jgi:hypothetical protein
MHSPLSTGGIIFILTILVNIRTILVDLKNKRWRATGKPPGVRLRMPVRKDTTYGA